MCSIREIGAILSSNLFRGHALLRASGLPRPFHHTYPLHCDAPGAIFESQKV